MINMKIGDIQKDCNNPFLHRPWMADNGAAASEDKPPPVPNKKKTGLKAIIARSMAGAVEICISYPTEYVKTHLQLDEKRGRKKYDGVVDCIMKTIKRDGVPGFYRGLSPMLAGSVPKTATRYSVYETLKPFMADKEGNLRPMDRAVCGFWAGVAEAVVAVTPMETIKVKFIHDTRLPEPKYKGLFHGVDTILKEEGLKGLYQGATATILRQGTNQAIRLSIMGSLRNWYNGGDDSVSVPTYAIGTFAAVAGTASVFANTPLDVVKTRMQSLEGSRYKNMWDCIAQILRQEGVAAFYKGTIPRLGRVCLDVAITFVLYESFMDLFHRLRL